MPVTITTPAESRKLTTKALVKADLDISVTTYDTLIDKAIDAASRRIVSYCRREFAKEIVTETLESMGGYTLMLSRAPIVTLASISYKGAALDASAYSLTDRNCGFVFNASGWIDTAYGTKGLSLNLDAESRKPDYSILYTAGFWLPSFTATSGTAPTDPDLLLPDDVELAARMMAIQLYTGRKRDQSVKQESATNVGSVTYFGGEAGSENYGGLPPMVAELLLPYRRAYDS